MPHQLFKVIPTSYSSKIESLVSQLNEMIDVAQREEWLILFNGGVPNEVLRWNGTLQEAYYLFNELRKLARDSSSIIKIQTKNGGLDWIKINQVVKTKYGKIQKESRPVSLSVIRMSLDKFLLIAKIN
jgi:hypothetical protein